MAGWLEEARQLLENGHKTSIVELSVRYMDQGSREQQLVLLQKSDTIKRIVRFFLNCTLKALQKTDFLQISV